MLVARVAINMALARTPNLIINPGARSALASALQNLAGGLVELVTLLIIIGLAAAAVVLLTGTGAAATRFRSASGGSILTANREVSATVAFGLAVLAIAVFGLDLVPVIVAAALSAVGVALLLSRKSSVSAA
jgi:predicted membrane protein